MSPQWEYLVIQVKEHSILRSRTLAQHLEDTLNEYGQKGWRMTEIVVADASGVMRRAEGLLITFERPIPG